MAHIADVWCVRVWPQGKLVGRVFEWLLPQPVDDCLRVLASCMLGGAEVTPLMCSTTETIGNAKRRWRGGYGESAHACTCLPDLALGCSTSHWATACPLLRTCTHQEKVAGTWRGILKLGSFMFCLFRIWWRRC